MRTLITGFIFGFAAIQTAWANDPSGAEAFNQLGQTLPTPNVYRTASGAPGERYWQQEADYVIRATLDETHRRITADSKIHYTNRSPDTLRYLWLQMDQNRFKNDSLDRRSRTVTGEDRVSYSDLRLQQSSADTEHGYQDVVVLDAKSKALPFTLVDTMMRIDLPQPLQSGQSIDFQIQWAFNIIDEEALGGRGGYEYFEENDTELFFLAQWFPRMTAYSDYDGWHNKAFLGRGEFTLEFGDYEVNLTVPNNHIVSATGELQNPKEVLSKTQQQRLAQASSDKPRFVVTP